MVEKTINQKLEMLIDYKIATLEAEKVSRDMELHYLNKWANAADAYINAMENEIKNLSGPEFFNGIEVIR